MDRDELILQKLSELAEDVKDLRKNVGGLQKDITDVKLQQADDRRRSETAILKLDGDLQRVESKIDGGFTNINEHKANTNERWEIGGIIISIFLAVSAFVKSFFFS